MKKAKKSQKISVPKVELQADATDHLVKLQKLEIDSSLGYTFEPRTTSTQ